MDKNYKKYFLGANSCEGFVSHFCDSYRAENGWKAYIIKGGPGTGKSSFMKYIVSKATEKNMDIELCVCSSDPNSLDGVILRDKKIIFLDGTAPHVVEPIYPGICEEILNFGEFWNSEKFSGNEKSVIEVTNRNKRLHRMAARYMLACGQLLLDNLKIASACTDKEKAAGFASSKCKELIPKKGENGTEWVRFIEGITPLGVVAYCDTVNLAANKIIAVADEIGSASGIIMQTIRDYALDAGYEIITIKNSFLPNTIIDHIIIPELSLAFVTENEYLSFKTDERRIHSRRFVNLKQLHKSRKRIMFNKKAAEQLLLSAAATLSEAKAVHDELEKYYISTMDFEKATRFVNEFAEKIL